jgi:hypothetical protein
MGKIRSFTTWLELQASPAHGFDPNKTQDYVQSRYVPSDQSRVAMAARGRDSGATGNGASDKTVDYRPGVSEPSPVDPDIAKSAQSLQGIHGQLRDIFSMAREKAQAFRYPKMKAAFDRELMAGIDGVGRAHAIILPTARGIENDDQ